MISSWSRSRAIQIYLVEKYGQAGTTDSLYPADPSKRALVNQLLFFDMGTLAQCAADAVVSSHPEDCVCTPRRSRSHHVPVCARSTPS